MNEIAKRAAIERLKKTMEMEKTGPSQAARYLNLNPCYISMALSEKHWNSMSAASWDRLVLWCNSGSTLSKFKIPAGEEIFVPKERYSGERKDKRQKTKDKGEEKKEVVDIPLKIEGAKLAEVLKQKKEKGAKAFAEGKKEVDAIVDDYIKIPNHPAPEFTDAVRLKVALDIEINLVVNGQKVQLR